MSPLMWAASEGHSGVVKVLMKAGKLNAEWPCFCPTQYFVKVDDNWLP